MVIEKGKNYASTPFLLLIFDLLPSLPLTKPTGNQKTKKLGNTFSKGLLLGAHSKTEVENGSEKRERETLTPVVSDVKDITQLFLLIQASRELMGESMLT